MFLGDFIIVKISQYSYANLAGVAYHTPRLYGIACHSQATKLTARYSTGLL